MDDSKLQRRPSTTPRRLNSSQNSVRLSLLADQHSLTITSSTRAPRHPMVQPESLRQLSLRPTTPRHPHTPPPPLGLVRPRSSPRQASQLGVDRGGCSEARKMDWQEVSIRSSFADEKLTLVQSEVERIRSDFSTLVGDGHFQQLAASVPRR